jgi:hypothetical protein
MESKVNQVSEQFKRLSEAEQKVVLERILEDRKNQVQAMSVLSTTVLRKPQHQNN